MSKRKIRWHRAGRYEIAFFIYLAALSALVMLGVWRLQ